MDGGDTLPSARPRPVWHLEPAGRPMETPETTRSERAVRLRAGRPAGEGSGSGDKHQVPMAGTLFRE